MDGIYKLATSLPVTGCDVAQEAKSKIERAK